MKTRLFLVLIATIFVKPNHSAPTEAKSAESSTSTEDLLSSIEQIQKRFSTNKDDAAVAKRRSDTATIPQGYVLEEGGQNQNAIQESIRPTKLYPHTANVAIKPEGGYRRDKMLGYFGYFPQPISPLSTQFYPPTDYYNDYNAMEEEEIMSRANRRRPQANINPYENSPIYYIRLPPTPYMFVPGYGYISQPPSLSPINPMPQMTPIAHMPPQLAPQSIGMNPFINVPINFLANGKPTNIYQWSGSPAYHPNAYPNHAYQPSAMGYPQAPQRPTYKPKPYLQDSKITHLKGQYLFNGRPEQIYLLPNDYNSLYSNPLHPYY